MTDEVAWRANRGVVTSKPTPRDSVVLILWPDPKVGRRHLGALPVAQYEQAVAFAERYAPSLIGPVEVLPYESADAWERRAFTADVTRMALLSTDPQVRAEACALLASLRGG